MLQGCFCASASWLYFDVAEALGVAPDRVVGRRDGLPSAPRRPSKRRARCCISKSESCGPENTTTRARPLKGLDSVVAGDADLNVVPDLRAGNMPHKSFVHLGGAECAGVVLGAAKVPIVLTSRTASLEARVASVALTTLSARPPGR